ncbi:hypothetical protein GCM10011487_12370 [Steroidobacter agaridevorans]|uniref:Competence protein CoiA-like N-terminal domain-containing protein n=1 Tax=Steroidobacter agaridevorans TaxID=2695856 RepID=A0A829Y7L5_9GAMM|nr:MULTISPECIES: competence protein CoiA family protein [Steroidobacteraceae]GFE79237.1 hypothetical protein GCM10011487_12370 [Steroidobacter agaridevorans]GFE87279.1 hypothetical protein GCM10011488_22330 [Steroidobacter agaridevorans]
MTRTLTPRDLPHDDRYIGYCLNESDELVHIDSVPRGKACGCRCVSCAEPLIARKGDIRVHHFAHAQQNQCTGALETLLHLLAKEILRTASVLALPDYTWRREQSLGDRLIHLEQAIVAGGRARLSQVLIEPRTFEGIIPDVVFATQARDGSARTILLEVTVSHPVDAEKLKRLRALNLPALELTLKPAHARLTRAELEKRILQGSAGKRWLFHPRELDCERRFDERYRQARDRLEQEQAERAKAEKDRGERMRRASSFDGTRESANLIAEFFARHGRFPTMSETSAMFQEALAKRKLK